MQRTIIEAATDGHILITLERNVKMGGSSHQRRVERKRAMNDQKPIEWYRMGRVIIRNGIPEALPVKFTASKANITLLPFGSKETNMQAHENCIAAAEGGSLAERIVETIDNTIYGAIVCPPKKRMVWVDEDDHVEVSQPDPLEYL